MKLKFLLGMLMLASISAKCQDAILYSRGSYDGTPFPLLIGTTITIPTTPGNSPSIKILSSNAGVKVKLIPTPGSYPEISFYTEINTPFVGGTNQYECIAPTPAECQYLEISCVERYLPQPRIFIPIDRNNVNPANGDETPPAPEAHKRMLMLRKAYFWENSEDIIYDYPLSPHGPFGEIKANVCSPHVMDYSYEYLVNHEDVWHNLRFPGVYDIPGHAWDFDYPNLPYQDDPRNEWVDNWWGGYYSNMALFNWETFGDLTTIALIISEADGTNEEDVLGRALIKKDMEGCILIKCRMFGWVVVQNVDIPASGREPSVSVAGSYLYNDWNGVKPEDFYGPNGSVGTQYEPFRSIADVESRVPTGVSEGTYNNNTVGVLGNGIISAPNTLSVDMTYVPAAPTSCETYSYAFNWDDRLETLYYRSRQTGNWNDLETWESSPVANFSTGVKSPVNAIPYADNSHAVIIRNGHTVTVTADITSQKTTVNSGAHLLINTGVNFTLIQ
jgi:hypothetical protein